MKWQFSLTGVFTAFTLLGAHLAYTKLPWDDAVIAFTCATFLWAIFLVVLLASYKR